MVGCKFLKFGPGMDDIVSIYQQECLPEFSRLVMPLLRLPFRSCLPAVPAGTFSDVSGGVQKSVFSVVIFASSPLQRQIQGCMTRHFSFQIILYVHIVLDLIPGHIEPGTMGAKTEPVGLSASRSES